MENITRQIKNILKEENIKATVKSYYKEVEFIFIDAIVTGEKCLHVNIEFNNSNKLTIIKDYYNYYDRDNLKESFINKLIKLGF